MKRYEAQLDYLKKLLLIDFIAGLVLSIAACFLLGAFELSIDTLFEIILFGFVFGSLITVIRMNKGGTDKVGVSIFKVIGSLVRIPAFSFNSGLLGLQILKFMFSMFLLLVVLTFEVVATPVTIIYIVVMYFIEKNKEIDDSVADILDKVVPVVGSIIFIALIILCINVANGRETKNKEATQPKAKVETMVKEELPESDDIVENDNEESEENTYLQGYIQSTEELSEDALKSFVWYTDVVCEKNVKEDDAIVSSKPQVLGYAVVIYDKDHSNINSVYTLYKNDCKFKKDEQIHEVTSYTYLGYDDMHSPDNNGNYDIDMESYREPEVSFETEAGSVTGYESYDEMMADILSEKNGVIGHDILNDVPSIDRYIKNVEDIPVELKKHFSEKISELTEKRKDNSDSIIDAGYEELGYLVTVYGGSSLDTSSVYALYKNVLDINKNNKKYKIDAYMYARYDNVIVKEDGTYDVGISSCHVPDSAYGIGTCFETEAGTVTGYESYEDMIADITSKDKKVADYSVTDGALEDEELESATNDIPWTFVHVLDIENGVVKCNKMDYVTVSPENFDIGTKVTDTRGTEYTIREFNAFVKQWKNNPNAIVDIDDIEKEIDKHGWGKYKDSILEIQDEFYEEPFYDYYLITDEVEPGKYAIVDLLRDFIPSGDFGNKELEIPLDKDAAVRLFYTGNDGVERRDYTVDELVEAYKQQKVRTDYELEQIDNIYFAYVKISDDKIVSFESARLE